jgi:hypothetical protein
VFTHKNVSMCRHQWRHLQQIVICCLDKQQQQLWKSIYLIFNSCFRIAGAAINEMSTIRYYLLVYLASVLTTSISFSIATIFTYVSAFWPTGIWCIFSRNYKTIKTRAVSKAACPTFLRAFLMHNFLRSQMANFFIKSNLQL